MKTASEAPLKVRSHLRPCRAFPYVPEWPQMPRSLATGVDSGVTQWPLQGGELAPLKDRFWPVTGGWLAGERWSR